MSLRKRTLRPKSSATRKRSKRRNGSRNLFSVRTNAMISGSLALAAAGAFTGASLYVNFVEQPARLALDDSALVKEWEPSDHRGFIALAGFALLSALFGFVA